MNKRQVVIVLQTLLMLQALTMAALTLSGHITIGWIVALSFIAGVGQALEVPARQAMLIELVGKEGLPNAIGLNSTSFNMARVVGPLFSTPFLVLLQDQGEGWAFLANGISFLFVIVSLFLIHPAPINTAPSERHSVIYDLREGQRFITTSTLITTLIFMASLMSFFGFPNIQQIPVFAHDVLTQTNDTQADIATRNTALVFAQGLGALIAAVTVTTSSVSLKRKGLLLTIGQFVFAIGLLAFSQSRWLPLSLLTMMLIGWGTVTALSLTNTLIQLAVPNTLRARVMSTYFWALQGIAPFGSLFIGWLADHYDAPLAALVGGVFCLLAPLVINLFTPTVRRITI
jgi:MFS family permease